MLLLLLLLLLPLALRRAAQSHTLEKRLKRISFSPPVLIRAQGGSAPLRSSPLRTPGLLNGQAAQGTALIPPSSVFRSTVISGGT